MSDKNAVMGSPYPATGANAFATGAGGVAAADGMALADFNPESLLAYCAAQLKATDADIKRIFAGQQKRQHIGEAFTKLASAVNNHIEGIKHGNKDAAKAEIDAAFKEAIEAAGPDTELGRKLIEEQKKFDDNVDHKGEGKDDPYMSTTEMKQLADTVKNYQSDLSTGRELDMLELQKLASSRLQMIQLTTGLLQKAQEGCSVAINNINKG
jgi:hypothetical protein